MDGDTVPAADADRLGELLLEAQRDRDTWRNVVGKLCDHFGVDKPTGSSHAHDNITYAVAMNISGPLERDRDQWKFQSERWAVTAAKQVEEIDRLWAKDEALQAEVDAAKRDANTAWKAAKDIQIARRAVIEKMRPVVDAAVAWKAKNTVMRDSYDADLFVRVNAYQSQQPATSESHEAMGPVKSCQTCRFSSHETYDNCAFIGKITRACKANDLSTWEPKP